MSTGTTENPKVIEKTLAKIEKQDTTLVHGVEKEIKSLEKNLTKLTKGSTKQDKNVDKATKFESRTAKKASQANIAHEKAAISLKELADKATITKRDRDNTSRLLDSKRAELDTANATKRHHDEQAAVKRSQLTQISDNAASSPTTMNGNGKTGVNA